MEFQAVLEAVRSWPVEDQVRLVHIIQKELPTQEVDHDLSTEQVEEIKRRLSAYQADPSIGIPWEEVEARMQQQLKELGE